MNYYRATELVLMFGAGWTTGFTGYNWLAFFALLLSAAFAHLDMKK